MNSNGILSTAWACADSTEQAAIIDEFARELFVRCGGRFAGRGMEGYEQQCCSIAKKMGKDARQLIKDLHAFVELYEKDMSQ